MKILIIAITLLLTGCLLPRQEPSNINWSNPDETRSRVEIKNDEFTKQIDYTGPNVIDPYYSSDYLMMRAWEKASKINYQVYVADHYYGDWRFYNRAFDSDGNKLDFVLISKKVLDCYSGCTFSEHAGLNVTEAYLRKHTETGLKFKIIGKAGEEVFTLPGGYIKGFLDTVNIGNATQTPPTQDSATNKP